MLLPSPTPAELRYVEDLAAALEEVGLPRMSGRVVAWLLICDPPEQTAACLAAALNASKGSISQTTRALVALGVLDRRTDPVDRRDHFSLAVDSWPLLLRARLGRHTTRLSTLTGRGLHLLAHTPPARRRRLQALDGFYGWLEAEMGPVWEKWEFQARRSSRARHRRTG